MKKFFLFLTAAISSLGMLADEPVCTYKLEMRNAYGDGWEGNKLIVTDNGQKQEFTMEYSDGKSKTVTVNAYGGTPAVTWETESYSSEVGFTFMDNDGVTLFFHELWEDYVESFDLPNPCAEHTAPDKIGTVSVSESDNVFTFMWEAPEGVEYYYYRILHPDGSLFYYGKLSEALLVFNANKVDYNGDWTFSVAPADENGMPLVEATIKTFTVNLPALGEIPFRIRWTEESTMPESEEAMLHVYATGYEHYYMQLTKEEDSEWWTANLDIQSPAISYMYVQVTESATSIHRAYNYITHKPTEVCLEIAGYTKDETYNDYVVHQYHLNKLDCNDFKPNYDIESAVLTPGVCAINVYIKPKKDLAEYYDVNLYTGEGDLYATNWFVSTDANWSITINDTVEITSWEVFAADVNDNPVGEIYKSDEGFAILPSPLRISGLEIEEAGDNKYRISWDINENVAQYGLALQDPSGSEIFARELAFEELQKVDGKYVFISPAFGVEGTALAKVYAGTEENWMLNTQKTFEVKDLQKIEQATLRILVPTDNNMDLQENGLWIYWCMPGGEGGATVKAEDKGNHWYEATFPVNAPGYKFIVVNRDPINHADKFEGAEYTAYSPTISEAYFCAELGYRDMDITGLQKWRLIIGRGCDAPDHDYSKTTYQVDNTETGIKITVNAEQYAYRYVYNFREKNGGTSYYYPLSFRYEGSNEFTQVVSNTEDETYEYYIVAYDKDGYTLAARYKGTVEVKANPCLASNLQAVVAEDNQTVTFTWTPSTNGKVAYYTVRIADTNEEIVAEGNSLTKTFYRWASYSWSVRSYDENDNLLGLVYGEDFTVTPPSYAPRNLTRSQNANFVIFTWEAPEGVNYCELEISDVPNYHEDFFEKAQVVATDGLYSYTYTITSGPETTLRWWVRSVKEENGEQIILSDWIDGDHFTGMDNYNIASATITPGEGMVTVSVTPEEKASEYYYIALYEGEEKFYSGTFFYGTNYEWAIDNNEAVEITSWSIVPTDEAYNDLGDTYKSTNGFTIQPSPLRITGLAADPAENNTYRISWDINPNVAYYGITVWDPIGTCLVSKTLTPSKLTQEDGKYVFYTQPFVVEGTAKVYLRAGNLKEWVVVDQLEFEVKDLQKIEQATLRILVPTDNNMDITTNGLWIYWWLPGAEEGTLVKTEEKEGRWFEATFPVNAPGYQFLVVNRDGENHPDKWEGAEQSEHSGNVIDAQLCVELGFFDKEYMTEWPLFTHRGCDVTDHDYHATYKLDNTETGVKITVNAKDLAYWYAFCYRDKETTYYTCESWNPEKTDEFNVVISNAIDKEYEYIIEAYDKDDYLVTERYYNTIQVKANPCLASNLQAVVAEDNQSVTFTWTPSTNERVAYYMIWTSEGDYEKVTEGNTFTRTYFLSGNHSWRVESYDENDNWLGSVDGEKFVITAPDYTPFNLVRTQDGNTVNFTWSAPEGVDFCWFDIDDWTDYDELFFEPQIVYPVDGVYSYTYTITTGATKLLQWYVVAGKMYEGKEVYASNLALGDEFTGVNAPTSFSVKFIDYDDTVLKTEQVEKGKDATPPAEPSRDGYTFTGWDKAYTNVQSDLVIKAKYKKNSQDIDQTPFPAGEGRGEASKFIKDGRIFILRDGKLYTIMGQEVK